MKKIKYSWLAWGAILSLSASTIVLACDKQAAPMHKTVATDNAVAAEHGFFIVKAAYARAVPPGQPNSAVFMQLQNKDQQAHALVKAVSQVAEVVELHNHVNEGGIMKMRQVAQIDLPAGETIELKPGGFHIMLIGLKQPLQPNAMIDLSLTFEEGTTVTVTAPIKEIVAPMH